MLYLLRSGFQSTLHRQNFFRLVQRLNLVVDPTLEIPLREAPKAVSLALKMRNTARMPDSTIFIGSAPEDTVHSAIKLVEELRELLPPLAKVTTIFLVNAEEWHFYPEIAKAPAPTSFFDKQLGYGRLLFLEQRESYSDREYFALIAHMISDNVTKGRDSESTVEFSIGPAASRKTGMLERVTDQLLEAEQARTLRRDEPTGPSAIDDDRITELPPPPVFIKSK